MKEETKETIQYVYVLLKDALEELEELEVKCKWEKSLINNFKDLTKKIELKLKLK